MKKVLIMLVLLLLTISCGKVKLNKWQKVELPENLTNAHILSIDIKDDQILLGTYGKGALLSLDNGQNWDVIDTSDGLSWNFILGGDWDNDYMILATLGDGLNISTDNGVSWQRYGYNFFGVEYLYTVRAKIVDNKKYVSTADGLLIFDDIENWNSITDEKGLESQYIYDMKVSHDTIALGTLHGYSISYDKGKTWLNFAPNNKYTKEQLSASKVRAVEFKEDKLYAGCDDGLFMSENAGKSWAHLGREYLSSSFVKDLIFDHKDNLWIITHKEIATYNLSAKVWRVFNSENGLPPDGINCVGVTDSDEIWVGTNLGLYKLVEGEPVPYELETPDTIFTDIEIPKHQWMLRPVQPNDQNCTDQTYLYGSTMGGNFRQHQGNEYNAPEGTPLLAVDDGVIVYIDRQIGHSVLKCNTQQNDYYVYAHYHHQKDIFKNVGDRVQKGEIIGTVGKLGNVTNEHLHFEVSLSKVDDSNKESHTRNPELWVASLPNTGTIVGKVVDGNGKKMPGARVYGVTKPIPSETPFSFAETYQDKVNPDEYYKENFVIGDVPEGIYLLYAETNGKRGSAQVQVKADMVSNIQIVVK